MSLNDRLLEFAEAEETQADSAFDLTVAAGRLFDIRNKAGPESTSAALLADAEDLERRAADSGQFTAAMLVGKLAAEILLDRNQTAEALAHLKATRDAYSSIVRTGGAQDSIASTWPPMDQAVWGTRSPSISYRHSGES